MYNSNEPDACTSKKYIEVSFWKELKKQNKKSKKKKKKKTCMKLHVDVQFYIWSIVLVDLKMY